MTEISTFIVSFLKSKLGIINKQNLNERFNFIPFIFLTY